MDQFEYQTLDGQTVRLDDYADKGRLIHFWATWCGPCIKEFPLLHETQKEIDEDMVFIMVSCEDIDKIKTFTETHPYDFIFLKSNNFLMEGISTVPQSFVMDKLGKVVYHKQGVFDSAPEVLADSLLQYVGSPENDYAINK